MKRTAFFSIIAIAAAICSCGGQNKQKSVAEDSQVAPLDSTEIKYAPAIPVGSLAPALVAPDTLGQSLDLNSLKGNYVVMDFWATWCPDCRHELPEFKAIYNDYKEKSINGAPVKFLSVSFDRDENAWKKMIREEGLDWLQVGDIRAKWKEGAIANDYKLAWIPTFYLIGPDGTVLATGIYASRMREALERL